MTKPERLFQIPLRSLPAVAPADRLTVLALDDTRLAVIAESADPTDESWQIMVLDDQQHVIACEADGWLPAGNWSEAQTAPASRHTWGIAQLERGYAEQTRILEWVRPLSITEKMGLVSRLKLAVLPPAILGIASSEALFSVELDTLWVLRRLRVAYRVTAPTHDYDLLTLHVLHPEDEELLETPLIDGVQLYHPTAPIRHGKRLVVTELHEPVTAYGWTIADA